MKNALSIQDSLKLLPDLSGVYLMRDKENEIIYIGKAKNLKKRVKSYFTKNHDIPKVRIMVPQIVKFEFIITDSEVEALILESHLIKRHKPKYNVLLKDDKKFPWFLVTHETYPRIIVTRKKKGETTNGRYFGPYTNIRAMYSTLELIKKLFPLKQCQTPRSKDRTCIYYQIGKCLGPCQKLITPEDYKNIVKQVELFLSGRQTELLEAIKNRMDYHSQRQEYEKAARFRDSYFDVKSVIEKQKVVDENTRVNQDIIGYEKDSLRMVIALLKVRDGRLISKEDFDFKLELIDTAEETLQSFLKEYYSLVENEDIPEEIIIPEEIEKDEKEVISQWLSYKKADCRQRVLGGGEPANDRNSFNGDNQGRAGVKLIVPKAGKKHDLVELAIKNASSSLEKIKVQDLADVQGEYNELGSYIKEKLELSRFPHHIECFDISHIQGTNTVASLVVFNNGKPCKSEYKRFKIRSTEGKPDDFESMKEVLKRRYTKILKEHCAHEGFHPLSMGYQPNFKGGIAADLIIVDGGKGQLSAAKEVLDELGLFEQPIVSLAKRLEEVFVPDKTIPVIFPSGSQALFLFQKIRDEAHRFAITYHRKLRDNQATKSILDEVPGIGHQKKKILFEHFDDIKGIMQAKRVELEKILGKKAGISLYNFLHSKK
ncbi:MAG: excinuclease ABC subunit UvrC [Candidatus Gastranaerophilaceae bacterium]|jgi:excinuclease ABC subunit C